MLAMSMRIGRHGGHNLLEGFSAEGVAVVVETTRQK
jgi:hypothetical protein